MILRCMSEKDAPSKEYSTVLKISKEYSTVLKIYVRVPTKDSFLLRLLCPSLSFHAVTEPTISSSRNPIELFGFTKILRPLFDVSILYHFTF